MYESKGAASAALLDSSTTRGGCSLHPWGGAPCTYLCASVLEVVGGAAAGPGLQHWDGTSGTCSCRVCVHIARCWQLAASTGSSGSS
jgi:hypothetical protein